MAIKKFKVEASEQAKKLAKKPVKASDGEWDKAVVSFIDSIPTLPEQGKVISKTYKGWPIVIVGLGNDKCLYHSYLQKANAASDIQFIRGLIKRGDAPEKAVENLGFKTYTRGDVEGACGKKKSVKSATGKKRWGLYSDFGQRILNETFDSKREAQKAFREYGYTKDSEAWIEEVDETAVGKFDKKLANSACGGKKSVKSAAKRSVKCAETNADLERAKQNIVDGYNDEYDRDFTVDEYFKNIDLSQVPILYTTIGGVNEDEHDYQLYADLVDPKIIVEIDGDTVYEDKFPNIGALADDLEDFDWQNWYSYYLDFISDEILDGDSVNSACGGKKSVKSSARKPARKTVRASTEYLESELADKTKYKLIKDAYNENNLTIVKHGDSFYFERTPSKKVANLAIKEIKRIYPELTYIGDIKASLKSSKRSKSVKAADSIIKRYSDVVPKEDRKYWYFTTHGLGPGMIPKGINVLKVQEGQNRNGTWGDFILLDAILNTDELKQYDLIELAPKDVNASTKRKPMKKSVKASASAKRRAAKRITSAIIGSDKIVMNIDGKEVYEGRVEGLADTLTPILEKDTKLLDKFEQWCEYYTKSIDTNSTASDIAYAFANSVKHSMEDTDSLGFYVGGGVIDDFDIEVYSAANKDIDAAKNAVKASKRSRNIKASSIAKRRASKRVVNCGYHENDGQGWNYDNPKTNTYMFLYNQEWYTGPTVGSKIERYKTLDDCIDGIVEIVGIDNILSENIEIAKVNSAGYSIEDWDSSEVYELACDAVNASTRAVKASKYYEITDRYNDEVGRADTEDEARELAKKLVRENDVDHYDIFWVDTDPDSTDDTSYIDTVYADKPFSVAGYYDYKFRDLSDSETFYELKDALEYAQELLGKGTPISMECENAGGRVEITPDEYEEFMMTEPEYFEDLPKLAEWLSDVRAERMDSYQEPWLDNWQYNTDIGMSTRAVNCSRSEVDDRFQVQGYIEPGFRGLMEDEYFRDFEDAKSYAHGLLMQGYDVRISDDVSEAYAEITSDEYQENFDGEFVVNEDIADFQNEVWRSMGIGASTKYVNAELSSLEEIEEWGADMPDKTKQLGAFNSNTAPYDVDSTVAEYITRNYGIYAESVSYVEYSGPGDWSVDMFQNGEAVTNDFMFFFEDRKPELFKEVFGEFDDEYRDEYYDYNAIHGNDFQFQFFPAQNQWAAPQIDIDEAELMRQGFSQESIDKIKSVIPEFESEYINICQEINYNIESFLKELSEEYVRASIGVKAALGNKNKTDYASNPIYELDKYVKDLAEGVAAAAGITLTYQVSDEAITFIDGDGTAVFIQPISEITPEPDDLENDIQQLVSAIQSEDWYNQDWEIEEDDPDYATRAVQMSVDDELEPVMGEGEDIGFGIDSNGETIDESTVNELYRMAERDILPKTELAQIDPYVSIDEDSWDFYFGGISNTGMVGVVKFYIHFKLTSDNIDLNEYVLPEAGMRPDFKYYTASLDFDIYTENGRVTDVILEDITIRDNHNNYSEWDSERFKDNFNTEALENYIEKLAAPAAEEIYNAVSNL